MSAQRTPENETLVEIACTPMVYDTSILTLLPAYVFLCQLRFGLLGSLGIGLYKAVSALFQGPACRRYSVY